MLTLKNILHLITESLKDVTHIYTCRYTMHTTYNTVCEKNYHFAHRSLQIFIFPCWIQKQFNKITVITLIILIRRNR